jgi:hypothetical protein
MTVLGRASGAAIKKIEWVWRLDHPLSRMTISARDQA